MRPWNQPTTFSSASAWAVVVIDSLIYAAWSAVEDGQVARREAADLLLRTVLRGLAPLPAKPKT